VHSNEDDGDDEGSGSMLGHNGGPALDKIDMDKLLADLKALTPEQLLAELQKGLLVDLVLKLKLGQVTHQDAAVIAKILKDNGVVAVVPQDPEKEAADASRPAAGLPDFTGEEEEDGA